MKIFSKKRTFEHYQEMKYSFCILLTLISFSSIGFDFENASSKYWQYRNRFRNYFISIGADAGQSLPFTTRNINGWNPNSTGSSLLELGEVPIMLGNYMALLATEYHLIQKVNKTETESTIKELFYALYAFNRLDLKAETVNQYQKTPSLNGFFIREDFQEDFIQKNQNLNKGLSHKDPFTLGSGTPGRVTDLSRSFPKTCDNGYATKYEHLPMSLDQFIGILYGAYMVVEFLPDSITWNNKPFQDGETSLHQEAQNIIYRITSYAYTHHWNLKEPDGSYLGDCHFTKKPTFTKNNGTFQFFSKLIQTSAYRSAHDLFKKHETKISSSFLHFLAPLANWAPRNYNARMYLYLLTLSDKKAKKQASVNKYAERFYWEPFFNELGIAINGWAKSGSIKKETENILASAPIHGPYYHNKEDYALGGWASPDRFSASIGEQNHGPRYTQGEAGNYSGLDYMILHNLHLINFGDQTIYQVFVDTRTSSLEINKPENISTSYENCITGKIQFCKDRYRICNNYYKKCKSKNGDSSACLKEVRSKVDCSSFDPRIKKCKAKDYQEDCKK